MHKKRTSSRSKNESLVKNQDHPFQPQYKAQQGQRESTIPYQSIKNSVPTLQNTRNVSIEMPQVIHHQHGIQPNEVVNNINNPFPINSNNQQHIPIGVPIGPHNNINGMMMPNPNLGIPIGLQPNPFNTIGQIYQPNPFNTSNSLPPINPALAAAGENFFQQLGGFNNLYYNALDPNLAQRKNTPIPIPSSSHMPILASTLIMFAAIIMALVGLNNFLQLTAAGGMIAGGVVVYMASSFCLSSIRKYVFNLKKFSDYSTLYNKMKHSKGYFVFHIQCYHYSGNNARRNGGRGGRSKNKIVTHTARHEFMPTQSMDDSGQLDNLKINTEYAFVKYLKRYYFTDKMSQKRFIQSFNHFVANNKRDLHQSYSYNFQLPGFQEETGFSATGDGQKPKILYVLMTMFGLCYPFSIWIERSVTRFELNVLKRLTI